jgi:hypothetical protein
MHCLQMEELVWGARRQCEAATLSANSCNMDVKVVSGNIFLKD